MPALPARLFRMLLKAYPRRFHDAYAKDMAVLFEDRCRDERARGRLASFLWRTVVNVAITAPAEHAAAWSARRNKRHSAGENTMSGLLQDLGYTLRLLRRQPAFTTFVALTLAVGIGANTAVFSVVNGVLLRPLPYDGSDRLVNVWGRFDPESGFDFPRFSLSNPEFLDYRQHTRALEDVAAASDGTVTVGSPGAEPERVASAALTGNAFRVLRTTPVMGRTFSDDEMVPGGPQVVVLSYGYWQSRFGADRGILGRTVTINGTPTTVIGVMPPSFAYPEERTRMWLPLRIDPANPGGRSSHSIGAIGRLADGITLDAARAELQALMNTWRLQYPTVHTGHYLFIQPMLEDVAGAIRPALMLLLAATGFVLLIVCANVASVVLARGEARTREMAIRGALGAERSRLVRLALVESAVLGVIGGGLGLALALAGVRALVAIDPGSVPRASELGLDYRAVAFAAGTAALSAVLFGLMPAVRGARTNLQSTLRASTASTTGSPGRQLFRRGLVATEVALSVVLALAAGLMLRSFGQLVAVEPGFRPEGLVIAGMALPVRSYPEPDQVEAFYSALLARVESVPGVRAVSAGSSVPMRSGAGSWDFEIEGSPTPSPGQPAWNAKVVIARAGYIETLGIPLVRGRLFTPQDDARAQPVVVINDVMAARFFGAQDPVGRRLRIAGVTEPDAWMTIIGVTASARIDGLDAPAPPVYHLLQPQLPRTNGNAARTMAIVARVDSGADILPALRSAVRELDPTLAIYDFQTSVAAIERSVAQPRFTTLLLTLFAGVGLLLGMSGIYGVLTYTIARQTQEIGIRRALGAQPRQLVRHVMAGGMAPVIWGLVIGLLLSHWTSTLWSAQLFNVSPTDPRTYLQVTAGVLVVAVLAMVVPIRRALRVSPLAALRSE